MDKGCAIVTGANGSMGIEISKGLSKAGYRVVMACRSVEKGEKVVKDFALENVTVLPLDLSSFHSIDNFVKNVSERFNEVQVLVNNAGAIFNKYSLSDEGYERSMAVNFIGPALLTEKILPLMPQGSTIVNTVSIAIYVGHLSQNFLYGNPRHYDRLLFYSNAKLAFLLYTMRLAEEENHKHVYAVDPGVVSTGIITLHNWFDPFVDVCFRPFIKSPENGASTALGLALGTFQGDALLWRGRKPRKLPRFVKNHSKKDIVYDFIKNLS